MSPTSCPVFVAHNADLITCIAIWVALLILFTSSNKQEGQEHFKVSNVIDDLPNIVVFAYYA